MAAHLRLVSGRVRGGEGPAAVRQPEPEPEPPSSGLPLPHMAGLYPVAFATVVVGIALIIVGTAWAQWSRWP